MNTISACVFLRRDMIDRTLQRGGQLVGLFYALRDRRGWLRQS